MPKSTMPSSNNGRDKPFLCEIFDPRSKFVNICNHILLFVGLLNLYIDPLLFYLPSLENSGAMTLDWQLGKSLIFLRSFGDFTLVLAMILRFRTGFEQRNLHAYFGKADIVRDSRIIAMKYLKSTFAIDFLASIPFPQVYLLYHIMGSRTSSTLKIYEELLWIFPLQFLPRTFATALVSEKIEKATGYAIRGPWSGTLYILFVYGMLSHYVGASYYFMYVTELLLCHETVTTWEANLVDQHVANCSNIDEAKEGLLSEAFANNISSRNFTQKYMFCFSWGLKTLSSMGQNLKSSAVIADPFFNIYAIIIGLLVFADLIARLQTCMQSVDEVEEQQIIRQRELGEWSNFHHLPPCLKKRVQKTVQSHLPATRDSNDDAILDSLPIDLRCEVRRHLYLEHIRNLLVFEDMDDQYLHAICGHLRKFTSAEGMYIVLEGEPIQQLLFIFSGQVELFLIDGGSSSCIVVGSGEFCGQELLSWFSLSGRSTKDLPPSACTVKCLTDVEAFSLLAKDLKLLAIHFNYDQKFFDALLLHHSF